MEELRVLMETLASLGDGAKTAFIVWVLVKYALQYVVLGSVFIGLWVVGYKISANAMRTQGFANDVKRACGFGHFVDKDDERKILKTLHDHFGD